VRVRKGYTRLTSDVEIQTFQNDIDKDDVDVVNSMMSDHYNVHELLEIVELLSMVLHHRTRPEFIGACQLCQTSGQANKNDGRCHDCEALLRCLLMALVVKRRLLDITEEFATARQGNASDNNDNENDEASISENGFFTANCAAVLEKTTNLILMLGSFWRSTPVSDSTLLANAMYRHCLELAIPNFQDSNWIEQIRNM
jgi:hypothetical protein